MKERDEAVGGLVGVKNEAAEVEAKL